MSEKEEAPRDVGGFVPAARRAFPAPVSVSRSAPDDIAAWIRELIRRGELGSNDRLPPERELCEIFGVARPTLREGLTLLRDEGYVEVRRGSKGGTFVSDLAKPAHKWLNRLRANPEEFDEIIDMRVLLEGHASGLAALNRTDDQLSVLKRCLEMTAGSDPEEFRHLDAHFHSTIAAASHSKRLEQSVLKIRGELFVPANRLLTTPRSVEGSESEHRQIYDAILRNDEDRARSAMVTHILNTRNYLVDALIIPLDRVFSTREPNLTSSRSDRNAS